MSLYETNRQLDFVRHRQLHCVQSSHCLCTDALLFWPPLLRAVEKWSSARRRDLFWSHRLS